MSTPALLTNACILPSRARLEFEPAPSCTSLSSLDRQTADPSLDYEAKMGKTTALGIDSHEACAHPALPPEELDPSCIPRHLTPGWTEDEGKNSAVFGKRSRYFINLT